MRSTLLALIMAIALVTIVPPTARADQATFGPGTPGELAPGQVVTYAAALYVGQSGAPNVVYENAASFAIGETVTAILSPKVWPAGFGTVELVGPSSVIGTTTADWAGGAALSFAPTVEFRYTAPPAEQLGCAESPGDLFGGYAGADVQFVGDLGTRAHTDATISPDGLRTGATFWVAVRCPEAPVPTRTPEPTPGDTVKRIEVVAASWVSGVSVDGGPWEPNPACASGGFDAGGNPPIIYRYRCAIEFELPSLPSTATDVKATFAVVSVNSVPDTRHIDLGGYVGNGTSELADLTAGSRILRPAVANEARNDFDVTDFVVGLLSDQHAWAGFNLSSTGTVDGRGWGTTGPDAPVLTITYAVGTPSQEPSATPAPTEPGNDDGGTPGGQGGTGSVRPPQTDTEARSADMPPGSIMAILFGLLVGLALARRVTARRSRRSG